MAEKYFDVTCISAVVVLFCFHVAVAQDAHFVRREVATSAAETHSLISAQAKAHDFKADSIENANGHPYEEPCSFLGCNSYECAWASGGSIMKFASGKACGNSILLGNQDGHLNVDNVTTAVPAMQGKFKINTLRDCVHLVKKQLDLCSGHFEMGKDSWSCSCVPADGSCTEMDDPKVCRYKIRE
mmetsp:Transcript_152124/g.283435  ORF Transcript_152124/g.283435 Transcript_152124/m.283435 type:complete len:185 (+) Transcript_152124:72-626(+)